MAWGGPASQKEGCIGAVGRVAGLGGWALGGCTPAWPWLALAGRGAAALASSRGRLLTRWVSSLCRCPDPPTGLPPTSGAHAQEARLL